ncbi:MAG: translation initiation factor IF-2 [Candidatus Coproplasma sp.]
MAKNYENIVNISKVLSDGTANDLIKKVASAEKTVSDILKRLTELDNARIAKRAEEERIAKEETAQEVQPEEVAAPVEEVSAEVKTPTVAEVNPVEEEPKKSEEKVEKVDKTEKPVKTENTDKKAEKTEEKKAEVKVALPAEPAKPAKPARPSFIVAKASQQPAPAPKTYVNRDNGARQDRPKNSSYGQKPAGSGANKPAQQPKYVAPAAPQPAKPAGKAFGPDKKKQSYEKTYVEKDRHAISKRALAKQQGVSVDDFDEDKSGYRKLRVKKAKGAQSAQTVKIDHAVVTTNDIPLKVLSEKIGVTAVEITKMLFKEGIMKTVNESIDFDTAAILAAGIGVELEYKPEKTAEEILSEKQEDTVEEIESLVPRAPVVTVMGHVDHGKTSLLDYIRKSSVTSGEAGGITQHIGAYSVSVKGKSITFIDTPGHEAFTAMRARGAMVTDIVILVVAADDGIMPQTVEAINHAKAAGVSIVVAINKMDKVGANPDKIKQDLTAYELIPEEWGGNTQVCEISCKTGMGIDSLLETVLLVAEMKELLANPEREARGVIVEAQLDKGKGPVATVLIQNGTLHTGDNIISGTVTGRVRAMIDDKGRTVKTAGPSDAVYVLGFEEVPNAGDSIFAVSQELIKSVLDERKRKEREDMIRSTSKVSLDDVFSKIAEGNIKTLNLIVKGDVQGSVEAVKQSVVKLSNEEVQVKVIHSGAGAITESDVMLADSSNAIILGFNVRPDAKAKATAEASKVDVRMYRIIYDLLDDVEAALNGMLTPKYQDVYIGKCEVRQTFKITGVGNIAGCYVLDGKIVRGGKLRIYRDDVLVVEGNVQQLKRFKDDVKEVAKGYECGCAIEGFNDIRVGDIIECYSVEQITAKK